MWVVTFLDHYGYHHSNEIIDRKQTDFAYRCVWPSLVSLKEISIAADSDYDLLLLSYSTD